MVSFSSSTYICNKDNIEKIKNALKLHFPNDDYDIVYNKDSTKITIKIEYIVGRCMKDIIPVKPMIMGECNKEILSFIDNFLIEADNSKDLARYPTADFGCNAKELEAALFRCDRILRMLYIDNSYFLVATNKRVFKFTPGNKLECTNCPPSFYLDFDDGFGDYYNRNNVSTTLKEAFDKWIKNDMKGYIFDEYKLIQ